MAEEKNKALIEEIAKHATIIDYHVSKLRAKPEKLHDIDIELLADKVREVYALIFELRPARMKATIADTELEEEPASNPAVIVPEPETVTEKGSKTIPGPVVDPDPEPEIEPVPNPEIDPDPEPEIEPVPEPEIEPVPEPEVDPDPEPEIGPATKPEPDPEPEPHAETLATDETVPANAKGDPPAIEEDPAADSTPVPEPRPRTTADLFSGTTTLADSFQSKKDNTIASRVVPKAVNDLKMGIGINDKFLFINELFRGDPSIYNAAIEKLNGAAGLAEAEATMTDYRQEFGWADNSEAYHRLNRIVLSKYQGNG